MESLQQVKPELMTAMECMRRLSWLTIALVALVVVLLVMLLSGNTQFFWVLTLSVLGAVLLFWLAGGQVR